MRIRRNIALTLCAALLLALCPLALPTARADVPDGLYVGGLQVTPGDGDFKYYRYNDSAHTLIEKTSVDYNVAAKWANGKFTVILNNLTVAQHVYTYIVQQEFFTHSSIFSETSMDIVLMGVNSLTTPVDSSHTTSDTSSAIHIANGSCSISGAGTLTARASSNTAQKGSYGIDASYGSLYISGGDITASGGSAETYSFGVICHAIEITGGKLTATAARTYRCKGISLTGALTLSNGELIASGFHCAIGFDDPKYTLQLGAKKWYEWINNRENENDPGGDLTDSAVTPYTYYEHDRYLHIRPLLSATPSGLDFGSVKEGYATPPAGQTITLKNNKNAQVTLVKTSSATHYNLSPAGDSFTLAANETKTFTVQPIAGLTAGEYNETFSFAVGECAVSIPVRFTVTSVAPAITDHPKNKTVLAGEKADFSIDNTGTTPYTYQWQVSTDGGTSWSDIADTSGTGSKTNAYLTPDTTAAMNGWKYRCVVTNAVGSATSNAATLTVNAPPAITNEPLDQGVSEGESATFSVTATGTEPLSYTWEVSVNDGANWAPVPGAPNAAAYIVANVQAGMDGYLYRCTISNGYGRAAVSRAAKLTVGHAPTISGDNSKTLHKGYYYTGSQYTVTGQPAPIVTLSSGAPSQIRWEDATSSLTIAPGLEPGIYVVTLTAKNGIAPDGTLEVTITVTDLVIAITSPASGPIYTDTPVTLTATATNFTSPTYQWYQNTADTVMGATPIPGAESDTYTFTPGAAGTMYYFCVVNGDSKTVSNILAVDAQTHLTFTADPAFNVPTGTVETPITAIDVSGGVSGGTLPYIFSLENAPSWLLITTAGVISGTRPTTAQATTTATVRVTDSGNPAQTATIEIDVGEVTPAPSYGIGIDPWTDKIFDPAAEGYGAQTAHTVTIRNIGNQPTGNLTIALSGVDAERFTLSKTAISDIERGGADTFTVVPKTGLAAKTYAAAVTVSGGNGITARSFNVSFTVTLTPVDPPVTENVVSGIVPGQNVAQGTSITFTAIGGGMDNQTPRAGDLRWRPSKWQSGALNGNFDTGYTQTITTAQMAAGTHTLSITYTKQRYDGANWVNVSPTVTDVKNVRFTISAVPVTGDFHQPMIWLALMMIGGMGVLTMILFIRRRGTSN